MTRHILTTDYSDLTLEERAQALQDAYQQGRDAAASDRAAGGAGPEGVEQPEADARTYLACVVEPIYQMEQCTDEELAYWREQPDDPRIDAFCRGWRESQRDYLADLANA